MITTLFQIFDSIVNLVNKKEIAVSVKDSLISVVDTTSLTDIAKLARVEPLAIVSKEAMTLDYLPDVMTSMLNIFIGYYLQAIAIGARVDSVKVIKTLDRLNPDRDMTGWLMASSMESLKDHTVMTAGEYEYRLPRSIALEADAWEKVRSDTHKNETKIDGAEVSPEPANGTVRDPGKILTETASLAVGKIINVEINVKRQQTTTTNTNSKKQSKNNDGTSTKKRTDKLTEYDQNQNVVADTTVIPVMVRLSPSLLPSVSIVKILAGQSDDTSFVERFHAWRSGRISFIRDLILCQDMIDEHRQALMHDEEGVYSEIMRRVNNSRKFGLLSQNPSLATASNLFVITHEVAFQIEQKLGGKLSNPRIREKAFESTYAMIIAVIDTRFNRVIFYHRGIEAPTDVSVRELAQSSKGKGPDIMDIFKAYQLGNAPSY